MIIGIPAEIMADECRVSLLPHQVAELIANQHTVLVEAGAGLGIGIRDEAYLHAGATVLPAPAAIYERADMIVKVKEPQPSEYGWLRPSQMIFTFFHLAANPELLEALLHSGCTAIAYETIEDERGRLPLLQPMSAIAGRLSVQAGAHFLEKPAGGPGILLGGVEGAPPGRVVIIGAGGAGSEALSVALAYGAHVAIADINPERRAALRSTYGDKVDVLAMDEELMSRLTQAHLIIGAALIPGQIAPQVLSRQQLTRLAPGTVLVDIAIDQGGCFASSRRTTHHDPVYLVDGVIHYAVANMPGAVPLTATQALTQVTFPYVATIANRGLVSALRDHVLMKTGVNVHDGNVTHAGVATAMKRPYCPVDDVLC